MPKKSAKNPPRLSYVERILFSPLHPKLRIWLCFLFVVLSSIALGFALTQHSIIMWDDHFRMGHSNALLQAFGFIDGNSLKPGNYAPLWELTLGIFTHFIFPSLHDPWWVRHALTFSLWATGLFVSYVLLRRAGVSRSTGVLCTAGLFSIIRFGGHALFNVKDVPGAVAYLLVSLYIWVLLYEGQKKSDDAVYPTSTLIALGVVSACPLLFRAPLLLHFVVVLAVLSLYSFACMRKTHTLSRVYTAIIPLISGVLLLGFLYPPFWGQMQDDVTNSNIIFLILFLFGFVFLGVHAIFSTLKTSRQRRSDFWLLMLLTVGLLCIGCIIFADAIATTYASIQATMQKYYLNFSRFQGWTTGTMVFGQRYTVNNLPWWYSIGWIPVIAHPVLLLAAGVGLVAAFFGEKRVAHDFPIQTWIGTIHFSLQRWLWIVISLSFAIFITVRPTLYDNERHILFLYPVFFLLGLLGLDFLHKNVKYALAATLVTVSCFSYTAWGRYSYIYTSPLIPEEKRQFLGDYWGLCYTDTMRHFTDTLPNETLIRMDGPRHFFAQQASRYANENALAFDPDFVYLFVGGNKFPNETERPFAVSTGTMRSVYYYKRALQDIQTGKAEAAYIYRDPYGEPICLLAYYPENDDIPPNRPYPQKIRGIKIKKR